MQKIAFKAFETTQKIKYNSQKPHAQVTAVIVDNFTIKNKDINGDGCPDLTHGEVVKAVAEGNLNYKINLVTADYAFEKENFGILTLLKRLKEVDEVKKAKAVNISIAKNDSISELNDKFFANKEELTPDNIHLNREKIVKNALSQYCPAFQAILEQLEKLASEKAIFLGAGNVKENGLNMLGLAKGVINVGSMTINEFQREKQPNYTKKSVFSADNSTLHVFAKGEYAILPIKEKGTVIGYDVTEDGIVDIPISKIQGHKVIKYFVGKDIEECAANERDYQNLKNMKTLKIAGFKVNRKDLKELSSKLFSMDELLTRNIIGAEEFLDNRRKGTYSDASTVLNLRENTALFKEDKQAKTPSVFFKTVENGRIVYNPHPKNEESRVIIGTSYAAPTAFAQYLNAGIKYGFSDEVTN